jgi:NADPH:quinone reductase-like Zn-dependent oxidoreductase
VAIFALQIAKAHGAEVIVTSGSDEKLALAKKLGASQGINRLKGDWAEEALALTQDRGIDHIIETVGGEPEALPARRCRSWTYLGHWRAGRV